MHTAACACGVSLFVFAPSFERAARAAQSNASQSDPNPS